jgi:hypothetical protein
MFTIASIKKNSLKVDQDVTLEQIIEKASEYIVFHTVDQTCFMEKIVDLLGMDKDTFADTSICLEKDRLIYQMCHISPEKNNKKVDDDEINGLSSYLIDGGSRVYGDTVVFVNQVTDDNTCVNRSIDLNDIIDILHSKFFHVATNVSTSGSVEDLTFEKNPLENMDNTDNYKYLELSYLKFNFIIYLEMNPTNDCINKKMTKFVGNSRIHGNCIITAKTSENQFIDFDKDMFQKCLKVFDGPLYERDLTEDETNTDNKKLNGKIIVQNRNIVLEQRYNSHQQKCNYCGIEIKEKPKVCTGCFRVKYHNKDCQRNDWSVHKTDCLHNTNSFNSELE